MFIVFSSLDRSVFGGKNLVFPTDLICLRQQLSRRLSRINRLSRTRDGRRDTPSTTGRGGQHQQWNRQGDYARAFEGAYFAKALKLAGQQERIGHVAVDPVLPVKAFFDIGGAGHSSDAMAIWIAQFVGREIRLLDLHQGYRTAACILRTRAAPQRDRTWKSAGA